MKRITILFFIVGIINSSAANPVNILFIGNSFTYVNDMPGMLDSIGKRAGKSIYVDSYTVGGKYIDYFVNNAYTYTKLHERAWDYVILQDNQGDWCSYEGSISGTVMNDNKRLRDSVLSVNPCCKVIWFSGWGWKGGRPDIFTNDNSIYMNQRIIDNFRYFVTTASAGQIIAPISTGWNTSLQQRPDIDLWASDALHPGVPGTYIGANVVYTTVFKESPIGNGYKGGFNLTDATFLQQAAYNAVADSTVLNNLSVYTPALTYSGSNFSTPSGYSAYQWYENGLPVSGANSNTYTPTSNGLHSVRATTSNGCYLFSFGKYVVDAALMSITNVSANVCTSVFTPYVTLRNTGLGQLTTVTISYQLDGGTTSNYVWTGLLNPGTDITIPLPAQAASDGQHTLVTYCSNPNNISDPNTANNQQMIDFYLNTNPISPFLNESFESTTFPPSGWRIKNTDNSFTWSRTTSSAASGSASAYINNKNYTINGQVDELYLPNINLSQMSSVSMSFKVAYQLLSDPSQTLNWSDTLAVLISTDCGNTYSVIYKKYGTALVTATPVFSAAEFFPSAGQWRMETIDLSSFSSYNNAIIKFKHTTDYENNLFIDDVNISGITSVNTTNNKNGITVYPNPASGSFGITITEEITSRFNIKVYNSLGALVFANTDFVSNSLYTFNGDVLPKGIYTIELANEKSRYTERLCIAD